MATTKATLGLQLLFQKRFDDSPVSIHNIRAHGSNREIFRLIGADGASVIGVYGPDFEENLAFLSFSRSFRSVGLPVPEIYAANQDVGLYLQEDLGDTTLFSALENARTGDVFPESFFPTFRRVVELLPRIQVIGGGAIDYSVAYPRQEFDERSIRWDLNYFKYHFLKLTGIGCNEERLENDFDTLTAYLLGTDRSHFLYRDFQARNIMLRGDNVATAEPWCIDYQGGRRGPLQYDIASLLYSAKTALPQQVRDMLLEHYLEALKEYTRVNPEEFREQFTAFVLIRILQNLGGYGYRGLFERKPHFIASIPYALQNIALLIERGLPVQLPELEQALARAMDVIQGTAAHNMQPEQVAPPAEEAGLTVHITSFSYKRGYPADTTGHGGGFVFDCRCIPNPGRIDNYKGLTGKDAPVIHWLQEEGDIEPFMAHVAELVERGVGNYLQRKFQHLSIAFGCTGGQHRSVYFAERTAALLAEKYPRIRVALHHREQDLWPVQGTR